MIKISEKTKQKLIESTIKVKWNNFGQWQKEDYKNLYDFAVARDVSIKEFKGEDGYDRVKINMKYGCMKVDVVTSASDVDHMLIIVMAQFCLYLGDRTKIETRYKNYTL